MKKIYPLILILLIGGSCFSQVKFCPPGAFWNFSFVNIPAWNGIYNYNNEQVFYSGDSIVSGDTLKMLSHKKYYSTCYNVSWNTQKTTFIKQKGDTIFFKNEKTNNTWQILINFAAPVGGGWQTTMLKANGSPITFIYVIDSITQLTVNNTSLKCLHANGMQFTERFGCSAFIFPYPSYASGCDGLYFAGPLCYSDQSFGTYQFSDKACTFSGSININGLSETLSDKQWHIYPVPSSQFLNIESNGASQFTWKLIDPQGKLISSGSAEQQTQVPVHDLPQGLYLLYLEQGQSTSIKKITVE